MTYVKQIRNPQVSTFGIRKRCCNNPNIVQKGGFNVCSSCGLTISKIIKNISKGNYSIYERATNQQNERVFTPVGPRTVFKNFKDGKGKSLSPESYSKFKRLAKINHGLVTSIERNLWIALPKFKILERKLNLPSHVSKEAYNLYINSVKSKLTLGRGIDNILAASFYTAIRIHRIPISVKEIIEAAQINEKDLIKSFKALNGKILSSSEAQLKVASSNSYLTRFNQELKLSMKCHQNSLKLINDCKNKGMTTSGKDPKGFVAAALYICAKKVGNPRTQKDICKITGISEVTLRARIKELQFFQQA